jgi:hypothetical protein
MKLMQTLAEFYGTYVEWMEEEKAPLLPWREAYMAETLGKLEAFMAQLGYVIERGRQKHGLFTKPRSWVARFDIDTAIRARVPIIDWPREFREEGMRRGYEGR